MTHQFKEMPYTLLCGICCKPKLDENHEGHFDISDMKPSEPILDTNFHPTEDMPVIDGKSKNPYFTDPTKQEPDCYGHKCPSCGRAFMHDYKCWPGTKEILHCDVCFGNATVEIHRNEDIIRMLQVRILKPEDIARILLEHEAFCVLEAVRDSKIPYETWFENHIRDLREMNERNNLCISASNTARLKLRKEDAGKFTQEELEELRKRSARQKKEKAPKDVTKDEAKKLWTAQLKGLISLTGDKASAEEKLRQMYKSKNKEIPE